MALLRIDALARPTRCSNHNFVVSLLDTSSALAARRLARALSAVVDVAARRLHANARASR